MELYYKNRKNTINAVCIYEDGIFTIKKGSKIKPATSDIRWAKKAQEYRNNSKIVDSNYVTLKDISFNSSSTAAQFVCAQSVNGNLAWKDRDGTPLKEIEKKL